MDLIILYAQFDMVNASEVQSSMILSACVNGALKGPLFQVCTHLLYRCMWYVLLNPVEFDFFTLTTHTLQNELDCLYKVRNSII